MENAKSIDRWYEVKYIKDGDYRSIDVSYDALPFVVDELTKLNVTITKIELR